MLITHLLADVHPGHRETAEAVLAALPEVVIATGRPLRVYAADTYNSLTLSGPVSAPVIIDITSTYEQKCAALAAHAGTQPIEDHFGPWQTLSPGSGVRVSASRAPRHSRLSPSWAACPPPRGSEPCRAAPEHLN